MTGRRVVITGVGAVTPLGVGARPLYERWAAGECGLEDGAGRCSDFDPTSVLSTKEVRRSDRFTQLAIAAGEEALAEAGWDGEPPYPRERVACVLGTGIGGLGTLETQHDILREKGPDAISALGIPLLMGNAGAAALAMRHGLTGECYCVVSACAASAQAIGAASRMIVAGEADAVVTGGSEATLTPFAIAAFARMGATSPSGHCRPFDARRDGFVMGEGAGVLVLEDADSARERGAEVLGELLGYGASADAHHLTAPEPEGRGAARALKLAMESAGVGPDEVAYINAHGTSTPLNDRSETVALKVALGEEQAHRVPISSTKSAVGHLLGAAGAVEAIATLLALRERKAPPTLGYEVPDEELDLDYIPDEARPLEPRANANGSSGSLIGLSSAFGFGGHNAVLCLSAS